MRRIQSEDIYGIKMEKCEQEEEPFASLFNILSFR